MLHHEYDAPKGYRFLGGAISFYSVSCMSDVIFNPSLLNWSSLILTVAHMFMIIDGYGKSIQPCFLYESNFGSILKFFDASPREKTSGQITINLS